MRKLILFLAFIVGSAALFAQGTKTHKVKKNETIYGIAHQYGITEAQLRAANPGMEKPGYVLKKGKTINIPVVAATANGNPAGDIRQRPIRLGVMLPLHNLNGDGRRMVEYYRGVLLACDTLRREGISVDVKAWNMAKDANVSTILADAEAARRDIIIGPLYSAQMEQMSDFCKRNSIMLVIPFSIEAPQLYFNRNIFQIYQQKQELAESTARRCMEWFKDYNTVIVDCADPESTKGAFTSSLRRQLDIARKPYKLSSLQTSEANFAAAFSKSQPNLVVLNSARLSDLKTAFTRLDAIIRNNPSMKISFLGYEDWAAYARSMATNFHKYDMHVAAPFFAYEAQQSIDIDRRYRSNFNQSMQDNQPRFALTGFDHAEFFLRGLHTYGKTFDGAKGSLGYEPVQTPLYFERVGNGGLQNRTFLFTRYKTDGKIDTIIY